ncbi:MAG: PHP domain-containing protein [Thermoflexales bacterium]|nr:PHP domain-containing protein [Thermoflexales bacterium]
MRTDLHCHSTASDGIHSPRQLVALARRRAIDVIALTDHDTIAGHAEAQAAGREHGVRVIPGIECSALGGQGETHVLGYGVEPTDEATRNTLLGLRETRVSRARKILARLAQSGIGIDFARVQKLAGDGMIGRPHIARAMMEVQAVTSIQEAFDVFLGEGKPAFVANDALDPAQAIDLIHRARGVAVLAHPGLMRGNVDVLLAEMIAHGLDGIEVYYPDHDAAQRTHYASIAAAHGLIVTGGSDYHGLTPEAVHEFGEIALPAGCIEALDARIAWRRANRDRSAG